MKPEHLSHKELLVRVRQLEQQNGTLVCFLEELTKVIDNYYPKLMELTDDAIRDFKKAKVVA